MTLGDVVKKYRDDQNISQRQFAAISGLTNGLISMIEKNENPKTGQPIVSSLVTMKKIADAMNISLNKLLDMIDDVPIELSNDAIDEFIKKTPPIIIDDGRTEDFVELFELLPVDKQDRIIQEIRGFLLDQ